MVLECIFVILSCRSTCMLLLLMCMCGCCSSERRVCELNLVGKEEGRVWRRDGFVVVAGWCSLVVSQKVVRCCCYQFKNKESKRGSREG